MLTIIIPAHNEAQRIGPTLANLARFMKKSGKKLGLWANYKIIVVSDGVDDTPGVSALVLKSQGAGSRLVSIVFNGRLGKGAAVKAGLRESEGDALIYDADGSTPVTQIPKLYHSIMSGADVAIGSRALLNSKISARPSTVRRAASKAFNVAVRAGFGLPFKDTQCGFKALSAKAVRLLTPKLTLSGFEWDVQMLTEALRLKLTVQEIPVQWSHSRKSKVGALAPTAVGMIWRLVKFKLKG